MRDRRETGSAGENAACAALRKNGLRILERNYRRATGEIDIIAREKRVIVFVEVKTRASLEHGRPAEAVTPSKQGHIIRTAMIYLKENRLSERDVRFDVVEVLPGEVRHIRGAFDAGAMRQ